MTTFTKRDIDLACPGEKITALIAFLKKTAPTAGKKRYKGASQEQNVYRFDETYKIVRDLCMDKEISNQRNAAYRRHLNQLRKIKRYLDEWTYETKSQDSRTV